jgi:hypothetical protein
VKLFLSLAGVLFLGACAGPKETLVVKQFQLRDQERRMGDEPMVRMEKARHLRGAVSMEERGKRLGQYYTLVWSDPAGVKQGPVDVGFQYRQGASASRVKRMTKQFPTFAGQGKAEFAVVGDDYLKNGRVLAWQATVSRGGRELAVKRSYLWK